MARFAIKHTKNYRLFKLSDENRVLQPRKHKKLEQSMKEYGFIPAYPIVTHKNGSGLVVKDGQHRLLFAETLGLPVYYVEVDDDFDIAKVNTTQKVWVPRDYAEKFARNGSAAYAEGIQFADTHGIQIGTAFALLAGTTSFTNTASAFYEGRFEVRDREWADRVASVYGTLVRMSPAMRNTRLLEACMAACRVEKFDVNRMIRCAERCREKLVAYSNREAYLGMMEEVYNFGQTRLFGLKSAATMAMRKRNPGAKRAEEGG